MTNIDSKNYIKDSTDLMIKNNPKSSIFSLPKITKVCVNVGVGKYDQKQKNEIKSYLEKLTGQTPKSVKAKVSVSGFKLRKGEEVGLIVTLRGTSISDFLLNLIYLGLPRTRDFKGISDAGFNTDKSSYSLGIQNCAVFPLVGFDTNINFGMQVNVVFAQGSDSNLEFLKQLNFPFKK